MITCDKKEIRVKQNFSKYARVSLSQKDNSGDKEANMGYRERYAHF